MSISSIRSSDVHFFMGGGDAESGDFMICIVVFKSRIKDAGIAISHSRGYIISTLQGLEIGWRQWKRCVHRQEVIKMEQFRPKITKIKVSTFGAPENQPQKIDGFLPEANARLLASKFFEHPRPFFCNIWPAAKYSNKHK